MKLGDYELAPLTRTTEDRWRETLRRWCYRDRDLVAYAASIAKLPEHLQCALIVDEKRRDPTKDEINAKGKSLDAVRLLSWWLVLRGNPDVPAAEIERLVTADNCGAMLHEIRTHRPQAMTAEDTIAILRTARNDFQREQASCPPLSP